jgi:hypothetical protein
MTDPLPSWNDTPTRQAIVRFVEEVTGDGRPGHVPPAERVAVFDNDGTLWCEKPMPIELGFILQRLAAMAEKDPALRDRQPWKVAHTSDHAWLGDVVTRHYHGDGGSVVYLTEPDVFDDGPIKPVRIWSRVGRRPILAAGNSNGDIPMLAFAGGPSRPGLRLLVLHDDPAREFDYVAGAEQALKEAAARGWTVVSIKRDWATVFGGT